MSQSQGSPPVAVSVVVVCFNERMKIAECLGALLNQSSDSPLYEIIVVDNESTDGTREIVAEVASAHPQIRLVTNPIRSIAISRNMGWRLAAYPYVAYTDADCVVPRNWLACLVAGFLRYRHQDPLLAAVGGGNRTPADGSRFYQALHLFLNSFLGSHGSVQGRQYPADRQVDHLPTVNVLYSRQVLQELDGFLTECGNIGEDIDLSYRLVQKGHRLIYVAGCVVIHRMRATPKTWIRNMALYGKGRIQFTIRHPGAIKYWVFLPMALVLVLLSVPFSFIYPFYIFFAGYLLLIALYSFILTLRRRKLQLLPLVFMLFVITHLAYGVGEWRAVLQPLLKRG